LNRIVKNSPAHAFLESLAWEAGWVLRPRNAQTLRDREKTKQVVSTPKAFLVACENEFGPILRDNAATHANARCADYFTLERGEDALKLDWGLSDPSAFSWLNFEWHDARPWVRKCEEEMERGCNILTLGLASIGSKWYRDHVHGKVHVKSIGRLQFEGETNPNGADLMLMCFSKSYVEKHGAGLEPWDWRASLTCEEKQVLKEAGHWF
jgi:hypothetical protein